MDPEQLFPTAYAQDLESLQGDVLPLFEASPFISVQMDYGDEPPLLEELGIDVRHVLSKAASALFSRRPPCIDGDLSGTFVFAVAYGILLALRGCYYFRYIYSFHVFGALSMHLIFASMSSRSVDLSQTAAVLGYGLFPMVAFSALTLGIAANSFVGWTIGLVALAGCVWTSARMIVVLFDLEGLYALVAYAVFTYYAAFVLLTIF